MNDVTNNEDLHSQRQRKCDNQDTTLLKDSIPSFICMSAVFMPCIVTRV